MPASLYRLANRNHHTEQPQPPAVVETEAVAADPVVESAATNHQASPEPELVDHADTPVEVSAAVETEAAVEASADENPADYPEWDPSWSKTQLLSVAQSLNLSVTSTNTKTEIINALTAATKA